DEEHEHHHHDGECGCHHHDEEHEHHHHDGECGCHHHEEEHGHHHHDGEHEHHHHHADEIFTSWGIETPRKFTAEELEGALAALSDSETYGTVLRAKGIVAGTDGSFLHFDFVPEEKNVRIGSSIVMGRLCVIGSHINEEALKKLFA
ncbi:MAG: GTP-binding protein, partial [Lachnospiraceae bacterium]|nr:GTP-binding protein [Lachnospiraceae bacterium]